MRIVASLTVKDEADRYLYSCLEWNEVWWDELFVWDDGSRDLTQLICADFTRNIKHNFGPTFMENEEAFRSSGWEAMGRCLGLQTGDWVFSFDADEFLVGTEEGVDVRAELEMLASLAEKRGLRSVSIPIPEVWDSSSIPLQLRMDGFWGTMRLPRFCQYDTLDMRFYPKTMGCGSTPRYAYRNPLKCVDAIRLLHFGYALPEERQERYDRYMGLKNHGHSVKHIKSIVTAPRLEPWRGETPVFYRGAK